MVSRDRLRPWPPPLARRFHRLVLSRGAALEQYPILGYSKKGFIRDWWSSVPESQRLRPQIPSVSTQAQAGKGGRWDEAERCRAETRQATVVHFKMRVWRAPCGRGRTERVREALSQVDQLLRGYRRMSGLENSKGEPCCRFRAGPARQSHRPCLSCRTNR
jgi:hypothetical protein